MKLFDRYIAGRFLTCSFLIILTLAVLFSFFELLAQLDDVGNGSYRLMNAASYVALTLPKRLLDLMPISTLLGGIIALGMLADSNELLAMQAAGISVMRICVSVLATGILLMAISALFAEIVVPVMEQKARKSRAQALSGADVTVIRHGFWARRKNAYIHVDKMLSESIAADIDIFEFNPEDRLESVIHAPIAVIGDDKRWTLRDITQKIISEGGFTTTHVSSLTLDSFLSTKQVDLLALPPYSLSTPNLLRYIRALRQSGQNADAYSIALWRKLGMPLTTGAMVLLSLSFVFGSNRSITAGHRITAGAFVGISLYFADQLTLHLGLLLNLAPFITAMIPVVLISGIAFWRLRRGA